MEPRFILKIINQYIRDSVVKILLQLKDSLLLVCRNIPFYCTRGSDLGLDKSVYLAHLESTYNVKKENMAFVGDDYFDLSMFKTLFWTFAPSDAPRIIRQNCLYLLKSKGGQGVVQELYDFLVGKGIVEDATENAVAELDKKEASSAAMK